MRKLKFRAWDNETKKYVKSRNLSDPFNIPTAPTKQGFRLVSKFILEQSIGRKDSKGIEIYENDIIRWNYQLSNNSPWFTAQVIFADYVEEGDLDRDQHFVGFMAKFGDRDSSITDLPKDDLLVEVIGNIHQNPDLLNP